MKTNGTMENNPNTSIQCVEVLVPKTFILNSSNHLFRTLSVYSLHNHAVTSSPSFHDSEIFHFMVYDWKRTLKKLLEDRQVPYTIVKYFAPDSLYYETLVEDLSETVNAQDVAVLL